MTDHSHVELRPGAYADSVTLLQVSRAVQGAEGVLAAQVAMATRPPGAVTRASSARPRARSAKYISAKWLTTRSKVPSAHGIASAVPDHHSTGSERRRATVSIGPFGSIP